MHLINAGASSGYSSVHQPEGRPGAFVYPLQRVQDLAFLQRQVGNLFLHQLSISVYYFFIESLLKLILYNFVKLIFMFKKIPFRKIVYDYGTYVGKVHGTIQCCGTGTGTGTVGTVTF